MKQYILLIFLFLSLFLRAQIAKEGVNEDPYQIKVGEQPYEMKDRKDEFTPVATFNDCTQWIVKSTNVEAALYRTQEERVFSDYSGKIVYTTLSDNAEFRVELKKPLKLKDWDCIELWNYGDHWCWGEPHYSTAMNIFVIVRDGNGKEHIMPIVQAGYQGIIHKYWFLSHFKLQEKLDGSTEFIGYTFRSEKPDIGNQHSIYLSNTYIFKEEFPSFTYKKLPEKLPFPLRKETIAPINKATDGKNKIEKKEKTYQFSYKDASISFSYEVSIEQPFGKIILENAGKKTVINKGASIVFEDDTPINWTLRSQKVTGDTLKLFYQAVGDGIKQDFDCSYRISQKSLVWTIEEKGTTGKVAEINLGTTDAAHDAKLMPVPFLVYNYSSQRPSLLYSSELFYFTMFDWYYTNASTFFSDKNKIEDNAASYNGGVRYIPLINGERNPVRERLYINISADVQEVFPTIDNPASPMRLLQSDRLWCIRLGDDLEELGKNIATLRSMGVEKVSVRNHEEFWREGGESYTFRLQPNPKLGIEKLQDFVKFAKSKDWRIGFYSNYTDFAPVNTNWNRDWVKMGPKGEWEVSWSRNYSPKPHIAWEQQAYFAPKIQKMFGTNHSYCDVHTAISPMTRTDYDFRSPGAGMFRTVIEYYGMLLMSERRSYLGPIYSEGGNHWWYAGLLEGNYANGDLQNLPVFPDFQLLKINPLQMDAANTAKGYEYLAYALAYGHIGLLSNSVAESVKRYMMIQPLQDSYSMVNIKNILYSDGVDYFSTSEAIKQNLVSKDARIALEYESGLKVYVNFAEEAWTPLGRGEKLPKHGFLAVSSDGKLHSSSLLYPLAGTRVDKVYSPDIFYLDTQGQSINGDLGGKGSYVIKREKFNWEIIPIENVEYIEFDLSLLGLDKYGVDIQAVDKEGNPLETINQDPVTQRVRIEPKASHFKYNAVPVILR